MLKQVRTILDNLETFVYYRDSPIEISTINKLFDKLSSEPQDKNELATLLNSIRLSIIRRPFSSAFLIAVLYAIVAYAILNQLGASIVTTMSSLIISSPMLMLGLFSLFNRLGRGVER